MSVPLLLRLTVVKAHIRVFRSEPYSGRSANFVQRFRDYTD